MHQIAGGKVVITTCETTAILLLMIQYKHSILHPCIHEEFDTRVMLYAANAASQGHRRILILANDTDVIVLGIAFFAEIGAEFGTGRKMRYIPIHDICSAMSLSKQQALPAFHALTGCDNTSFFSGTGKKLA